VLTDVLRANHTSRMPMLSPERADVRPLHHSCWYGQGVDFGGKVMLSQCVSTWLSETLCSAAKFRIGL
jgi:hypothetical protein